MKITRRQLRNIIRAELVNEGMWDSIKSGAATLFDPTAGQGLIDASEAELVKMGGADATALYKAMKGMGTNESKIKGVLQKRAADLHVLYEEYQNLIRGHAQYLSGEGEHGRSGIKGAAAIASNLYVPGGDFVTGKMHTWAENEDLITWLENDGLDEEAAMVATAVANAGIQRSKPLG